MYAWSKKSSFSSSVIRARCGKCERKAKRFRVKKYRRHFASLVIRLCLMLYINFQLIPWATWISEVKASEDAFVQIKMWEIFVGTAPDHPRLHTHHVAFTATPSAPSVTCLVFFCCVCCNYGCHKTKRGRAKERSEREQKLGNDFLIKRLSRRKWFLECDKFVWFVSSDFRLVPRHRNRACYLVGGEGRKSRNQYCGKIALLY